MAKEKKEKANKKQPILTKEEIIAANEALNKVSEKFDYREDRFINELKDKIIRGTEAGDIDSDLGKIAMRTSHGELVIDTDPASPVCINKFIGSDKIEEGNLAGTSKVNPKVSDEIDDTLTEQYDETLRERINEGFELREDTEDPENRGGTSVEDNPGKPKTNKEQKDEDIAKRYRNNHLDIGYDLNPRSNQLTPHDDAEKVLYAGLNDKEYPKLKLVEATVADMFNELARRFSDVVVLLKRPLINVDDNPLDKSDENHKVDKKNYKKTGARNDRLSKFKVDNRSFVSGDPHVLYGMMADIQYKVEEVFGSQMEHFFYDGNIASAAKSSSFALTKKKAGLKKRKNNEDK